MVKQLAFAVAICLSTCNVYSQIHILRYNDDFSHLKPDTVRKTGADKLKYIPLWKGSTVSFGADFREQFQYYKHKNFGDSRTLNGSAGVSQLWHRAMLHSNIDVGAKARVFAQLGSTFRLFNPNPLTPEIDENRLSLHQAFAEYHFNPRWSTRLGRQEIAYGNNRVLTFREGPNTRQAFDAALVRYGRQTRKVDMFVLTPVISMPGVFDDESFKDLLLGWYGTETILPDKVLLDLYFINYVGNRRRYNYIAGHEVRQSYGLRLFTQQVPFGYELEVTYQTGKFNALQINAISLSGDLHYELKKNRVTLGLAASYASGDRTENDGGLNTYNFLFSKPQFGLTAALGASNIVNINPYITIHPAKALRIDIAAYLMSRQSNRDGLYSPLATQLRPRQEALFSSDSKDIGTQLTLEAAYKFNRNLSAGFEGGYFVAGQYVKETGRGNDISFLAFKVGMKI